MTREIVITLQDWQIDETLDIVNTLKRVGIDDVDIRDVDSDD